METATTHTEPTTPPPFTPPAPAAPRRLMREDGMISGVSGGLASYFNLDPTLVRMGVVVGSVLTFPAIPVAYLAAWAIMPQRDSAPVPPLNQPAPPVPAAPTPVPTDTLPTAPVPDPVVVDSEASTEGQAESEAK